MCSSSVASRASTGGTTAPLGRPSGTHAGPRSARSTCRSSLLPWRWQHMHAALGASMWNSSLRMPAGDVLAIDLLSRSATWELLILLQRHHSGHIAHDPAHQWRLLWHRALPPWLRKLQQARRHHRPPLGQLCSAPRSSTLHKSH